MAAFGATILDASGLRLDDEEKAFFRDADPFGFILFGRNIESPDQVRALCDEMREAVGRDAVITIDQEGGRVQRLRPPEWSEWRPPLEEIRRAGEQAAEVMHLRSRIMAAELRALGIDSNCAPLVDVITPHTHDFLTDRCYGDDPAEVARIGRAVADGLLEGGVLPVMKHIPGHGRATSDSHLDLPRVEAPLDALTDVDFAPFAALADLPMAMTAHVVYEACDDRPATLSREMVRLMREVIGFDGLLMTDDISMKALSGTPDALARASLDAGCDVVLLCNAPLETRRAVAGAAGRMTAAAHARAESALARRIDPGEVDISALKAKLAQLQ
ncbi:beta-N-acetylhexosaminidase [Roseovarius sp. SCSIO 43702]|uniref:beta-N-acetylhexosaminidase n=1 Tax=Roseovarius sp. SCSIO 43702 TaxID=2823043 RepID=UPI002175C967|nr:beta-N-acetylhexosaminidase [Roseovarius sp. SCSIO 43702]